MKSLHNLQGQFDGFHFLIRLLNSFNVFAFFIFLGTISQINGAKYIRELFP